MNVGWIGTGVMGAPLAGHLLKAGHEVVVATRTPAKADEVIRQGARLLSTPAEVAHVSEAVFTMVSYPGEVEEVYFGQHGLFSSSSSSMKLVVDLSTTQPTLSRRIAGEAKARGIAALDAPVSGGWLGARQGCLAIMTGGDKEAFDLALPLLQVFGKTITWMGPAGAGQQTKLGNQLLVAGTMIGLCEALRYAETNRLDPSAFMDVVGSGAAQCWSLSNLGPKMIAGDYAPGFYIEHFIKDLDIVIEECRSAGLDFPGLALAATLYREAAQRGLGRNGTQALYEVYKARSNK